MSVPVKGKEPFLAADAGWAAVADAGGVLEDGLDEDEDGLVLLSGLVVRSPRTSCAPGAGAEPLGGGVVVEVVGVGVDVVQPPGVVHSLP